MLEKNCLIQKKKPMTPLTPDQKKKHNDSDKFINNKKVSTTKVIKKLKIMIITLAYTGVQYILYVILDTAHKEIYLL